MDGAGAGAGEGGPVQQVLALLRERQEQEVEALRQRQQAEVQQCLQQLQGVAPDQLACLLAPPGAPVKVGGQMTLVANTSTAQPAPPDPPAPVKVGGQVTLVANATFSLEGGALLLGPGRGSDTNNNTPAAPNHYYNNNNNNYYYPTTTTTTKTTSDSPAPMLPPPPILPPAMEYYRLCTPEEEDDKLEAELTPAPPHAPPHSPQAPHVTLQPGLFRVFGSGGASGASWDSPRPTTITSLLASHPEAFAEEGGAGEGAEAGRAGGAGGESGLDMVPQRESEATGPGRLPRHPLARNPVFIRGLVRLQACIRRQLTQRLLHTRLVQEQVATLAEIAKLARQFHRDIVSDNLRRGDIQLHKALYKQEGLARERIWRVFHGLGVGEQMSLLRHDRKLGQAGEHSPGTTVTRHPPHPLHPARRPDFCAAEGWRADWGMECTL